MYLYHQHLCLSYTIIWYADPLGIGLTVGTGHPTQPLRRKLLG